jgi:hypothetical protein
MRVILAAILGGIVMFAWGAVTHMVFNVDAGAVRQVPNEPAFAAAMKENMTADGMYFVPGLDMTREPTGEEMAAFTEKYRQGPTALIVYHQVGGELMTPMQFGTQFGGCVLASLLGAMVLAFAGVGFGRGVVISTLIGIAGWVANSLPLWNWYKFPMEFIRGGLIDEAGGWFFAGLVMALILRRRDVRHY